MSEQNARSDELFDKLAQDKKKRRRKLIRTVVLVIALAAAALLLTVLALRRNVERRFSANSAEVLEYRVSAGTIHTVVSGSGVLAEEDLDQISVPMGGRISTVQFDEDADNSSYTLMETNVLELYPNIAMSITISIDETDILALEEGQEAEVVVSSVSEDTIFPGTVTEISKVADTSTGVTRYSAEVTLDRGEGMLPGMPGGNMGGGPMNRGG